MCVHFLGGGMAGLTAASATYPLDLVRTRLAAQVLLRYCSSCSLNLVLGMIYNSPSILFFQFDFYQCIRIL